jgi:PAS domain S-box-containing protein
MLDKIISIGISDNLSASQQASVRLANIVSLLFVIVNGFNLLVVIFFVPIIIWITLLAIIFSGVGWLLNYLRLFAGATLWTAISQPTIVFFTHIAVINLGEEPIFSLGCYAMTLAPLPWVLIDLRQKGILALAVVIDLLLVALVSPANGWIEMGFDNTPFRGQPLEWVILFAGGMTLSGMLWAMKRATDQAQHQNKHLLAGMKTREQTLEAQKAQMNQTIATLQAKEQAEAQQAWASQALIELGQLQQQSDDPEQLAQVCLPFLVRQVKADQAGLFLLDASASQPSLHLVASHAYGRKKYLTKTIAVGEGLLGQAFLEKETTIIQRLPEGYTTIASGLGEASPRQLILIPLVYNQQAMGVLEMAAFQPLAPYQVTFLERAAQNLAAAMLSAKQSAVMRQLLAQAQHQAEEMRANDEEMRQNLEELTSTQEEVARLGKHNSQVFEVVNHLVGYVEFSPERRVLAVNPNFSQALGYQPHELIGQAHQTLAGHIPKVEYEAFWDRLLTGQLVTGIITRQAKDGQLVRFQAIYRPILNQRGKVEKVIKLAYPIAVVIT